jgi:DNA-binding MarR family transcriptional regulator
VYLQYRQLLTPSQWNFLIAVAKEDEVNQITSQKFIQTHRIGTPANARRISKSLEEKELLLVNFAKKSQSYQVYDVFFSRWLEREY